MKRQLQVVVALAVLGISVLAATAVGQINLGSGEGSVNINLPDGGDLDPVKLPACSNLKDDDGDGKTDLLDPGCSGPSDGDEYNPPPSGGGDTGGGDVIVPPGGGTGGDTGGGGDPDPVEPGGGQVGGGKGGSGSGKAGDGKGGKDGNKGSKSDSKDKVESPKEPMNDPEPRTSGGVPTNSNPSVTIADFGPAPIGVPNFVIDEFTIPPFLLPIYQACGTEYGIPWEVLASINRIETAFGTNLNVSSAGALGWMQFIPSSWKAYGVDANNDGRKDPYNPVDAICAAANYLKAAGGQDDLPRAIFAYNHADWYVDEVLLYARQYGKLPDDLIGSLTGLTEGARFPVAAKARYADDISEREALKRAQPRKGQVGNAADVISDSPTARGINIYSREGAPVIAVNDGVVKKIGKSKRLGKYLVLEDTYGNKFTYAGLGSVSKAYPVPKRKQLSAKDFRLVSSDGEPTEPASAARKRKAAASGEKKKDSGSGLVNTEDARDRLYAFPQREANIDRAGLSGQLDAMLARRFPGYEGFKATFSGILQFDRKSMELRPLREGSKVTGGTVLGRIGEDDELAPHLHFAIRPTGRGAPKIDPKPILDGWKLLEATAIYRAAGKNPFSNQGMSASVGQVLLMSKEQLIKRTLNDPRLEIYSCGREDIRSGGIDRRILAMLSYLTERGFRLTITSLSCGRSSIYTASGGLSAHPSGNAVDIAQVNGLPVLGNQGKGSITEAVVLDLMQLQGTMAPDQIITLMDMGGNTFAMGDHHDHIHVGYTPEYGAASDRSKQFVQLLKPDQWERLIGRLGEIDNPTVPTKPSKYSLLTKKKRAQLQKGRRASAAHVGE